MKVGPCLIPAAILFIAVCFVSTHCEHASSTIEPPPENLCIDDQPVEDTTRVYQWPLSRDTLQIYPQMVFARFFPWVKDTTRIRLLAEKHHLHLLRPPASIDQQLFAWLCITDGRRAEFHFTPYGKTGFCNFGADSLVEYAFGVFDQGRVTPLGNIILRFIDDTPQARIDSLFDANGLRFLYTTPDFPAGTKYWTIVTPRARKNFLDLAFELQKVPFAIYVGPGIGTTLPPLSCE